MGTLLIRNRRPLGPYSRTVPKALWGSEGGARFRFSEVPLISFMVTSFGPSPGCPKVQNRRDRPRQKSKRQYV